MNGYLMAMKMVVASSDERLFGLDPQTLHDAVLLAINIFIIFLVFSYLLFNPARELFKKRQDKIQDDLDHAAQEKEKANVLREEYEAKLADVSKEAEMILAEARKKAQKNEAKIIEEAKEEASVIMRRAQNEIELEKKRAIEDMKLQMINIAEEMAKRAVSEEMDVKIQDALIQDVLKEMGESTWQN